MSEKKYIDNNALAHIWLLLKEKFGEKVDKVEGKGLSTHDLTDELLQKINDAGSSSFSGDYNDLINKPTIPTNNNQLDNGAGYQTASDVQTAITSSMSSVYKYKGSVADRELLPTENLTIGDVYNLEDTGMNVAWTGTEWDDLGTTIDLDGYLKDTDLVPITNQEIDEIINSED